jgi:hypothetical protein
VRGNIPKTAPLPVLPKKDTKKKTPFTIPPPPTTELPTTMVHNIVSSTIRSFVGKVPSEQAEHLIASFQEVENRCPGGTVNNVNSLAAKLK